MSFKPPGAFSLSTCPSHRHMPVSATRAKGRRPWRSGWLKATVRLGASEQTGHQLAPQRREATSLLRLNRAVSVASKPTSKVSGGWLRSTVSASHCSDSDALPEPGPRWFGAALSPAAPASKSWRRSRAPLGSSEIARKARRDATT